jgi:hypothetical protein
MMHPFRSDDTDKDEAEYADDPVDLSPIGDKETFTNVINETLRKEIYDRDWRMHCYDTSGEIRACGIDSDHGAVRVALTIGEQEQFFELRGEQAAKFQAALNATLGTIKSGGSDKEVRWEGHCYNEWSELSDCLIEASEHDAVRIACVTAPTDERDCSLELRGDQIEQFQATLAAAMEVCHADVAIHGEHWADDEADETEEVVSSRGMEEAVFVEEINKMVAAGAPKMFAMVAEIGDRVDAMITVWCVKFPDRTEVISDGPHGVRGSFQSLERARKLLSAGGKIKLRLVSVAEAQKQVKTV